MNMLLRKLEDHLLRGPKECAGVLGLSYSHYAAMKSNVRPMPNYIAFHIEALMELPLEVLTRLVRARLRGGKA